MASSFITGFILGLSLIMAIGAQNTFVLRQGILGQHMFYVALFCALSDALLIVIGVTGISIFFNDFIVHNANILYGISALWLSVYGLIRLRCMFKGSSSILINKSKLQGIFPTLTSLAILTFANPHVYLDTMVLIGSVSHQFSGQNKIAFTFGAVLASFVFFFSLTYGARTLKPIMVRPLSWQILDGLIAFIMFGIALNLAYAGNWL